MRQTVVMLTTSYPRFPGDGVGSFIEPIAKGVAARGHAVHLVAPWHPAITRSAPDDGVTFHFYRYAPTRRLNVFGYASGLRADTHLRAAAWLAAPAALAAGWLTARRIAARHGATVLHGHWVVPGGVTAALAAGNRPVVVSLHGSDVYVAERHWGPKRAAAFAFRRAGWVTACSDDLRDRAIALGAAPDRIETLPYGVDTTRFAPDPAVRAAVRGELGAGTARLVFSAGRLVRKKGFEYLIDAVAGLAAEGADVRLIIAGDGDLRDELRRRAAPAGRAIVLVGNRRQDEIARLSAAADAIAVPSVRDDAGNVDGLPNFALEALASATPVVATTAGGLGQLIRPGRTGLLVPERDPAALRDALRHLLDQPEIARAIGAAAREDVASRFGWPHVAERLEAAYERAAAFRSQRTV